MPSGDSPSPLLEGPVGRQVLRIALPTVGSTLLMTANSFADRMFLGWLGANAIAAATVVQEIKAGLITLLVGLSVGAAAIVGRSLGAGEIEEARIAARQSVVLAMAVAIPCSGALFLLAEPLLAVLGLDGDALALGVSYFRWTLLSVPSLFLLALCNGLYGTMGETRRALRVILVAVGTNIVFDYWFIFGKLGFPAMGIAGGGAALCVS
ncbi:MAG: MATE family efflux transporter [Armatimonadota bacterium]